MQKILTVEEATKEAFLFISYSHDDRETVESWANFLLGQGVRVFWDEAFKGGDDWETIAETLLAHENCYGILFFASESSLESENVAKEWRAAARAKENQTQHTFYAQIIIVDEMANDETRFDYKYCMKFIRTNEQKYSDEDYDDFRNLFGKKDHMFYSAAKDGEQNALLENINKVAKQTVNKFELAHEQLSAYSDSKKAIVIELGTYGLEKNTIVWRNISDSNDKVILLSEEILDESPGGECLNEWLKTFVRTSFSGNEAEKLQGKVRLLTVNEAEQLSNEELNGGKIWWLSDTSGHLQSVVREDGTIYQRGYHNKLCKKGVRPIIVMDSITLCSILDNLNN